MHVPGSSNLLPALFCSDWVGVASSSRSYFMQRRSTGGPGRRVDRLSGAYWSMPFYLLALKWVGSRDLRSRQSCRVSFVRFGWTA